MLNKHYIRLDPEGWIIAGFSDAFCSPMTGDICINESAGRQFVINGATNPDLWGMNGAPLYRWADPEIVKDPKIVPDPVHVPTLEEKITALEEQSAMNQGALDFIIMNF